MRRYRCFKRASLVGAYSPEAQAVTLPFGKDVTDPFPFMTMHHELVHRDLTDKTVGGFIDRLLAGVSGDDEVEPGLKEQINQTFDEFFSRASLVHEGTATYASGLNVQRVLDSWDEHIWDSLPEAYQADLKVILAHLPGLDTHPRPPILTYSAIALACAKAALNVPDLSAIIEAEPKDWEHLSSLILKYNPDERFKDLLHYLEVTGGIKSLITLLDSKSFEGVLDRNIKRDPDNEKFLKNIIYAQQVMQEVTDSLEHMVHDLWPDSGPYLSTSEKLQLYRQFIDYCNSHIFDANGRSVFEIVIVPNVPTSDLPRIATAFTKNLTEHIWLDTAGQMVDHPFPVIDWLNNLARVSMSTQSLILIQAREFINARAASVTTRSGQVIKPGEFLLTFDPWVNPVAPDSREITADEAANLRNMCRGPLSIKTNENGLSLIVQTIEKIGLHVFWHDDWRIGLAAAHGAIDLTPIPGVIRIFYLDSEDSTTETFESVVRSLAPRGGVSVSRSDVFDGALAPYVAWQPGSSLRWSMFMPTLAALHMLVRLKSELRSQLNFDINKFGDPLNDAATNTGLKYFYGLAWDEKWVYEDVYK